MNDVFESAVLSRLPWIEHGFGARDSAISQEGMASLVQVHSSVCLVATQPQCIGEGDALVTASEGLAISVRTADCFPILLADKSRRAIAAIHAGWRGTADGIVTKVVSKMRALYGIEPQDMFAAIGPGIRVCCYEVGEEVARRFGLDHSGRVDLESVNRQALVKMGVPECQIGVLGLCTFCDSRFYSFRREKKKAGRMISYIRLRPDTREDTTGAEP